MLCSKWNKRFVPYWDIEAIGNVTEARISVPMAYEAVEFPLIKVFHELRPVAHEHGLKLIAKDVGNDCGPLNLP